MTLPLQIEYEKARPLKWNLAFLKKMQKSSQYKTTEGNVMLS
jgi:hypothetical protein